MTDDDTHEETFHLSCDAAAVRSARRLVATVLRGHGWHEWDVDRAQLVVSELVTNAVVHARTAATMRVCVTGPALRVDVSDAAPGLGAAPREVDLRKIGGLGLHLVTVVSRAWGVDRRPSTKSVWCEMEARYPSNLRAAGRAGHPLPPGGAESALHYA